MSTSHLVLGKRQGNYLSSTWENSRNSSALVEITRSGCTRRPDIPSRLPHTARGTGGRAAAVDHLVGWERTVGSSAGREMYGEDANSSYRKKAIEDNFETLSGPALERDLVHWERCWAIVPYFQPYSMYFALQLR